MTDLPMPADTRPQEPVRVGLLTPYFAFFDERFPPSYRPSQEAYAARLADSLRAEGLQVVESGLVDGSASAAAARARFEEGQVQVVVAAATMAAPPSYGSEALRRFAGPIVIWDDRRVTRLESDVDEVEATRASSMLGSVMLANVLGREDRRYLTVSSMDGDASDVARAVVGSAAGASLRGARMGLLGGIIPGYGDVVLDLGTATQLGIQLVDIDAAAVAAARAASFAEPATPVLERLPAGLRPEPDAQPLLARSLRVHRFLTAIAAAASLDALALNCHSDLVRWDEELGVVGCLGSSLLWAAGLPVACTGDAATAVALMLAARIAGSAQYCEGYAIESDTGEWMVSSCGMADLSLRAPGTTARLCANELYPGRNGLGIATRFAFEAGPATIVAFGPASATRPARLVASTGRLSGRGFEHLNGPSGTITFDRPGVGLASAAWIDAGPAHHLALIRGDRLLELRAAAQVMGVPLIEVGPGGR